MIDDDDVCQCYEHDDYDDYLFIKLINELLIQSKIMIVASNFCVLHF